MSIEEAKKLLEKVKPFEGEAKTKQGAVIDMFFAVPVKLLSDDYSIDWYELRKNRDVLLIDNNEDYTIVGITYTSSVVGICKDIEWVKSL